MYILGISAFYHDSAACLLLDDEIIAAVQEERFSRIKNDASFPFQSINFCLKEGNIKLSDLGHVVFYEKPFLKFERLLETYLAFAPSGLASFWKSMPVWIKEKLFQKKAIINNLQSIDPQWNKSLLFTEHHQSHAASAYYPSPFNEALILTVDGVGEWTTTSVARGSGNSIEFLRELKFPHSIGLLYSAFTYYLGFKVNSDEYKVMGLAPFGEPIYSQTIYDELIDLKDDGSFRLNMRYFNYCTGLTMTNDRFHKLFGSGPRLAETEITTFHMDMACSIQEVTEEIMLRLTKSLHREFGLDNLCLAGGVALNCVVNGKILKESGFKEMWIQPAAGDAGGAVGAAYAAFHQYLNRPRTIQSANANDKMKSALLGPSHSREDVKALLTGKGIQFNELDDETYYQTLVQEIEKGKVIAFFHGRMEFGPRALGARSIVGDPRRPEMQCVMNLKIKNRESFRPFAPVILEEHLNDYFDLNCKSPYMLLVSDLLEKHRMNPVADEREVYGLEKLKQVRSHVPAVTHVNYSSRIQTISRESDSCFFKLLTAFYDQTGCPMLINTSFNVRDEPIVCSPEDGLKCFFKSEIDILAIENLVVYKSRSENDTI